MTRAAYGMKAFLMNCEEKMNYFIRSLHKETFKWYTVALKLYVATGAEFVQKIPWQLMKYFTHNLSMWYSQAFKS